MKNVNACKKCSYFSFVNATLHRLKILVVFSALIISAPAQVADSIASAFHSKPKLTGGLSSRQTFIDGFRTPVLGVRLGLDFKNIVRIGMGYCYLKEPYAVSLNISSTDVPAGFYFSYALVNFEYVFHRSKHWQFSIPFDVGAGGSYLNYFFNGKNITTTSRLILIYEPVVSGQYKITRWLGAGSDIGYRFMYAKDKPSGLALSSPVYSFSVIIFWGELCRMAFPKKD